MPKDIAKRFGVPACPPKSGDFRDGRDAEGVIEMADGYIVQVAGSMGVYRVGLNGEGEIIHDERPWQMTKEG
jgi:hypothetical protein